MGLTKIKAKQISNLDFKQAARVVTITDVTLVGGAPAVVDGVSLLTNDRVLVTGQTNKAQNGIYRVSILGTGSDGTWIRTTDADVTGEVLPGMVIMVTEGAVYADRPWKLTTNGAITIGVTELDFELFNGGTPGGANTNIQFNDSGTFAGSANLIWLGDELRMVGLANVAGNVSAGYFIGNIEGATGDFTGNVSVNTVLGNIDGGTGTFTGNVSGNYFLGNGSQLTGLPQGYGNANVIALGESGWGGNILPSANITYDLGNATNRWRDIYLANSTIYLGEAEISAQGANLLLPATVQIGDAVLDASSGNLALPENISAVTVTASGNITAGNLIGTTIAGTLSTASQPNVTSVGTLTSLSVTGNVSGGNLTTGGAVVATGNITGGNLLINDNAVISGNLTVQGTETIFNVQTLTVNDKDIVVANNVTGGANVNGAGILAGNPTTASFVYNNATSSWQVNVGITPDANGALALGGTSNRWGDAWVTTLTATGNANVGNIGATNIVGTLATAAQTNITSVGTLTSLSVTGNVSGGNLATAGRVDATGNITGGNVSGTLLTGTLATAAQPNVTSVGTLTSLSVTGNVSTGNVSGTLLTGTLATAAQPNVTSVGTLSALTVTGNVSGGNLNTTGAVVVTGTGSATSTTTGSLRTAGGLGVSGNTYVGGLMSVTGNITTTGVITANTYVGNGSQLTGISAGISTGKAIAMAIVFG